MPSGIAQPQTIFDTLSSEKTKFRNSVVSITEIESSSSQSDEEDVTAPTSTNSAFDELVEVIKSILGHKKDLKSEDVDTAGLISTMQEYISNPSEWDKYAIFDLSRKYTRNLVDNLNGNANLILMAWTPGKSSAIHDHTNAHCIMRVLQGGLTETKYEWPTPGVEEPLRVKEVTHFKDGQVAYINDNLGLHKVENSSDTEVAVSLHLYTPPYIEQKGCKTFNEKTGRSHHIKMAAYNNTSQ